MADTPELTRRGFIGALGAGVALVAAPAVVRASSLMRIVAPPDWRDFVREIVAYDVNRDLFLLRWDVKFAGQQLHVFDEVTSEKWRLPGFSDPRAPALECLANELRQRNVSPFDLQHLPLPEGALHARTGVRKA